LAQALRGIAALVIEPHCIKIFMVAKSSKVKAPPVKRVELGTCVSRIFKRLKRTPARIGVSRIDGVGLIAVRNIAKGEKLFVEKPADRFHDAFGVKQWQVSASIIDELQKSPKTKGIAQMVRSYLAPYHNDDGKEVFPVAMSAMNLLHPIWYLNEAGNGHKSNVKYINRNKLNGGGVVALRNIKAGEELLGDYDDIVTIHEADEQEEKYPKDKAWVKAKAKVDKLRKEAIQVETESFKAEADLLVACKQAERKEIAVKERLLLQKEKARLKRLKEKELRKQQESGTTTDEAAIKTMKRILQEERNIKQLLKQHSGTSVQKDATPPIKKKQAPPIKKKQQRK